MAFFSQQGTIAVMLRVYDQKKLCICNYFKFKFCESKFSRVKVTYYQLVEIQITVYFILQCDSCQYRSVSASSEQFLQLL